MIDHSRCEHPRTSSARAKCRRSRAGGHDSSSRSRPGGRKSQSSSWAGPLCSEEDCIHISCYKIRFGLPETNYGQTPGRREDECHICHVEKIEYYGKDAWSGRTLLVGEKCAWRVKRSLEFRALP